MIALSKAATRYWRTSLVAAALAAAPLLLGSAAWAQGNPTGNQSALRLVKIIPVPVDPLNAVGGMFSFDISWVDQSNGLYYLGDRSNAAIDVVDTTGAFTGKGPDTFFGQIGGFTGDTGVTSTSGPDGVVAATSGGITCIFGGDGNSTLKSFSSANFTQIVSNVNTGGQFRVDEMAVDPADSLILVANNADTPAFSTLFSYNKSTCALSNPIKTVFTTLPGGHMNTNGIEQSVWDPGTQKFYVSLPEIDGPGDGTGITGAVAQITTSGTIAAIFPINYCQPAGLVLGPNGDLLAGCNSVFGFDGKKCSAVVPSPSPNATVGHPATCTAPAFPQSAVCNPARGCTGNALVSIPGAGGGDEVAFNPGDGNYYVTAGNDPKGPLFAVLASGANTLQPNTLSQVIPTLSPIPAVLPVTAPNQHGSGTVHSVAASKANNHVYVPIPANNAYTLNGVTCKTGCIAVFSAQ
jgi:hypothetical protein